MIKNFEITVDDWNGCPVIVGENPETLRLNENNGNDIRLIYLATKIQEIINYINKEKEYEI